MASHPISFLFALLVVLVASATAHGIQTTTTIDDLPSNWNDLVFQDKWLMYQRETIDKAHKAFGASEESLALLEKTSNSSCASCLAMVDIAKQFILNKPNFTKEMLDSMICDKKFANKTSDKKLCYIVVDVAIYLAAKVIKMADGIHWALPQTVCADILPKCTLDCCATPTGPEQIHLSFATSETVFVNSNGSMTVSWLTTAPVNDSAVTFVKTSPVGAKGDIPPIWRSAPATTGTYTHGGWVGTIYTAIMDGLDAGSSYTYYVGSPTNMAVSKRYVFNTFPADIGTSARPLRTLALADMGFMNESDATVERMRTAIVAAPENTGDNRIRPTGDVDMVLHYGDIGYADGNEQGWDFFGRKLGDITAVVPYMTTPGNHELLWNFTAYKRRMRMPTPGAGAPNDGMFYKLDVNGVGFLMLDSETPTDTAKFGNVQLDWMAEQLQTMKSSQKFIAVAHHRPLYCTSYPMLDCSHWSKVLRGEAEGLYNQGNVAIVQNGHLHDYERTWPVYENNCTQRNNQDPTAPIYVTNGAAGNREGETHFEGLQPWSVFRTTAVGYMVAEYSVNAAKAVGTMNATFFRSRDNSALDKFVLSKRL